MAADPVLSLRKQAITAIKSRLERIADPEGGNAMTRAELAESLGISRARLDLLMKGKAAEFSLEALIRIAINADMSVHLKLTRPYSSD
jgi:predicted XRE-type DNA-binding protein